MPLVSHPAPSGLPSKAGSVGKELPPFAACPREEPTEDHNDWLALANCPVTDFALCPTCYNTSFAPTSYSHFFIRAAPQPPDTLTFCDFSKFWVRRAWIMVFMHGRPNLSTLVTASAVTCPEGDCPSQQDVTKRIPAVRTWYSIAEPTTGQLLTDFTVCSNCAVHIETLMPQLRGLLQPVSSTPVEASCDIRSPSKRCKMFLDHLQKIADTTEKSRHRDVSELVNFIKSIAGRAECPRNNPTTGRCYSMSNIPNLTVCEECYLEMIAPQRQTGTSLSAHFTDLGAQPMKFTCQLYSPRMRGVWEQANAHNDIDFLRQTVSTRRSKESEISSQLERLKQVWEQQKQQVNYYQVVAENQQNLATLRDMSSMAFGGGYVSDYSGANAMLSQATIAACQADQTRLEIQMLENEWKSRWE